MTERCRYVYTYKMTGLGHLGVAVSAWPFRRGRLDVEPTRRRPFRRRPFRRRTLLVRQYFEKKCFIFIV
jgi:hypothetical protein